MKKTMKTVEYDVAVHIPSGTELHNDEWMIEQPDYMTDEEWVESAQTDYERRVDIVDEDDEEYSEDDPEQEHREDYSIVTSTATIWDRWADASEIFAQSAERMGYDRQEIVSLLENNRNHGAYRKEHGSCSERILSEMTADGLGLADDEIESLIDAMGGASYRHESTEYDEMRSRGISAESAREFIQ